MKVAQCLSVQYAIGFYTKNVKLCNRSKYLESQNDNIILHIRQKLSPDGNEYICFTCHKSLIRKKIPAQAVINNLKLEPLPNELKEISSLEAMLVVKRIPFMKILALPKGKQKAIHGRVVNVPVNPDKVCGTLP